MYSLLRLLISRPIDQGTDKDSWSPLCPAIYFRLSEPDCEFPLSTRLELVNYALRISDYALTCRLRLC